eukprot:CAMPEP_0171597302 /NCGR_PEP_ID=MMETSP0990-20121206/2471_1 /TAXON_ID=483369 /ORGANISM="non described non described, Strain CCMP2098" /LENGTH=67 /DNA_ID=CAMNT_0012158691 /DNA_START=758 /DNA_END=961 /DNA_ORIENTATION=-
MTAMKVMDDGGGQGKWGGGDFARWSGGVGGRGRSNRGTARGAGQCRREMNSEMRCEAILQKKMESKN